jgi:hypothetical protein
MPSASALFKKVGLPIRERCYCKEAQINSMDPFKISLPSNVQYKQSLLIPSIKSSTDQPKNIIDVLLIAQF